MAVSTNPLIAQGSLNRLSASVTWTTNQSLNVTPSFLNKDGISLSLDGEATTFLPTLTGAVTSNEPYMMITLMIHLLKTQSLSGQYKAQLETNSNLGDGVVRVDTRAHPAYDLTNCAISTVREITANGENAGWSVTIRGYYQVNNTLWSGA